MADFLHVATLIRRAANGEMSRRELAKRLGALGFTASAIGAMVQASASAQEGTGSPTPDVPVAGALGEGQYGGTLIVALNSDVGGVDLMWGTPNVKRDVMGHVFEHLYTEGDGGVYVPQLADNIEISEDGTTFTISLRQGVPFHNGKEMTASDVIASIDRWRALTSKAEQLLATQQSIETPDDYTIVITLSEPSGAFISGFALHQNQGVIMPSEVVEASKDEAGEYQQFGEEGAIGTGPYMLESWVPDSALTMVRFEDFKSREEPPNGRGGAKYAYADRIEFIPVPDDTTRLNGLITGEYHVSYAAAVAQFEQIKSEPDITPQVLKPGSKVVAVFNKQKGPFTDVRLRQAALFATDPIEVMAGTVPEPELHADICALAGPEWAEWYNEAGCEFYNAQDMDRAKQLLEESGYDGSPLRWITTRDYDYMYTSALIASEQWKQAGFNIELVVSDWPTVVENRSNPDAYEIFSTGIGFSGDPTGTSAYTPDWPGWTNSEGILTAYDNLLKETDPELRQQYWADLQYAFYTEVPYIQFGERYTLRAHRNEAKNVPNHSTFFMWNTWLEQ